MALNIEIKARVDDLARVEAIARDASDSPGETLEQRDTFFRSRAGRLKLRETAGRSELIFYERPDQSGPKRSAYTIVEVPDPASLRAALASALGVIGVVFKRRRLYRVGAMRIHLDDVARLGTFVELEYVVSGSDSASAGERAVSAMMDRLGIDRERLVPNAYVELLPTPFSE